MIFIVTPSNSWHMLRPSFDSNFITKHAPMLSQAICFLRSSATSFCSSEFDIRSTSKALSSLYHKQKQIQISNFSTTKDQRLFLKITFAARMLHSLKIALSLSFSSIYCTTDKQDYLESWIHLKIFPTIPVSAKPDCWYCWHAAPLHLSLLSKNEQAVAQTEVDSSAKEACTKKITLLKFTNL